MLKLLSEGTAQTAAVTVVGSTVSSALFLGKQLEELKKDYLVYIDGTEVLTSENTTLASDGVIDLGSSVFNGATAYIKKLA